MGTLNQYGIKTGTDKSSAGHNYLNIYEEYFKPIKNKPINFLEIGVHRGKSMLAWMMYFTKAKFYGVDEKQRFDNKNCEMFVGRQQDRFFLSSVIKDKLFDVIIDDGGHKMKEQQVSFGYLFPFVRPGGLYIIEDLHSSLTEKVNPTKTKQTTLKIIKELQDKRKIISDFMYGSEIKYIEENFDQCDLRMNKICFIKKIV